MAGKERDLDILRAEAQELLKKSKRDEVSKNKSIKQVWFDEEVR